MFNQLSQGSFYEAGVHSSFIEKCRAGFFYIILNVRVGAHHDSWNPRFFSGSYNLLPAAIQSVRKYGSYGRIYAGHCAFRVFENYEIHPGLFSFKSKYVSHYPCIIDK